ncbi:hypothetical protein KQI86_19505 [Clostridium sp. MSJ-11]|uniref:Tetrahydrofolate dehydrogenase/cyclohydrolase NAD(P)-binding domain-containing protein n=1 Tax=Clostridium mobile TaxID=2841512 RepID=A0ABS6EPA9_9CLOT|nr:hypothetical protein [Clostridium mobile]MBU5486491.1 hypothetical protein [Clostridium mobile]
MIIDCKKVADSIHLEPKPRTLGIIRYGEHKDAEYFCKSIMKQAEGTKLYIIEIDLNTYDYKGMMIENMINACDKIVCCNPFPKEIKELLQDMIPPQKDIDNFTGRSRYRNCTAEAVRMVLEDKYESIEGLNATVLGANVGWEIARELKDMGSTVTVYNSKTKNEYRTMYADIIVSAVGKEDLIKYLPCAETIIDVGNDIGDLIYEHAMNDLYDLTPQRNGIGLITTKILLKKVLEDEHEI